MPLVLFHTRRVREVLKAPTGIFADLAFVAFIGSILGMLIVMARQASAPMNAKTEISLSLWKLPIYTLMSLCRGFAAYFLSLVFTLLYATYAAHNKRAEKLMIPALDVLQSIPVLSFLPTVVLAMIALFPTREIGLEIACVVMIFTGQAWNMTFSMFGSIRAIPAPLREASQVYRMGSWRVFRLLELPASMIGLVWNSMMSMAGGWFVLTLSEAFTLQNRDFRLPGIGSYMGEAINAGDADLWKVDPVSNISHLDVHALWSWLPAAAAVVAMVAMILAVDQLFWRPIVTWSERFKMEETAETDKPQSWVLDLFAKSKLYQSLSHWVRRHRAKTHYATPETKGARIYSAADRSPAENKGSEAISGNSPNPPENNGEQDGSNKKAYDPLLGSGGGGTAVAVAPARALMYAPPPPPRFSIRAIVTWIFLAALAAGSAIGLFAIARLLLELPLHDPAKGEDWIHVTLALGASLLRTSASVAIGGLWTLPVGIIIGLSAKWSQRLQPVVQVVASFPANMLFPLITLFLVLIHVPFTAGCVALMLLGTQWYILFNVIAGAMAIPGDLKEVGTVFGCGWAKRWTQLYIPCVFPYLVTGLVTAAGGAWNATIVSEYVKVGSHTYIAFGIGSIISEATDAGNYPLLASATVLLAASVVLINRFFWKRLYRLAESRYTLNV